MELFWHILDRGSIHFTASTTLVLMVAVLIRAAWRQGRYTVLSQWMPRGMRQTLVVSGLVVWSLSILREASDVAHGQPLVKAFTDNFSWLVGVCFSCWALYRWRFFDWED